jgi:hypothetical protein
MKMALQCTFFRHCRPMDPSQNQASVKKKAYFSVGGRSFLAYNKLYWFETYNFG